MDPQASNKERKKKKKIEGLAEYMEYKNQYSQAFKEGPEYVHTYIRIHSFA